MVRAGRKRAAISACVCSGGVGRQQAELHFARHGNVAFELLFLTADSLVKPRVLDGDSDLRSQRSESALDALR